MHRERERAPTHPKEGGERRYVSCISCGASSGARLPPRPHSILPLAGSLVRRRICGLPLFFWLQPSAAGPSLFAATGLRVSSAEAWSKTEPVRSVSKSPLPDWPGSGLGQLQNGVDSCDPLLAYTVLVQIDPTQREAESGSRQRRLRNRVNKRKRVEEKRERAS